MVVKNNVLDIYATAQQYEGRYQACYVAFVSDETWERQVKIMYPSDPFPKSNDTWLGSYERWRISSVLERSPPCRTRASICSDLADPVVGRNYEATHSVQSWHHRLTMGFIASSAKISVGVFSEPYTTAFTMFLYSSLVIICADNRTWHILFRAPFRRQKEPHDLKTSVH